MTNSQQNKKIDYETLFSKEVIAERVAQLGKTIAKDFNHEPIIVVGVLKGAFIFTADLVRAIESSVRIDFIGCSSYEGTKSTGTVRITQDLSTDIAGRNVLVVEDIIDTGRTLDYLVRVLKQRAPKMLKTCALLDKPDAREVPMNVDYAGFKIKNEFVIGYGLDLNQDYRQLPFIAQVRT